MMPRRRWLSRVPAATAPQTACRITDSLVRQLQFVTVGVVGAAQAMAGLWCLLCTQPGSRLASWQAGVDEFADRGCGLVRAKAEFAAQEAPGGEVGDRGELG